MRFFENTHPAVQTMVLLFLWLITTIIASSLMILSSMAGIDIHQADNILWLQMMSQVVSFMGTAFLFAWLFYDDRRSFFHLDFSVQQWRKGGVAMLIMLLMIPVVEWLTIWNDGWHLPDSLSALESQMRAIADSSELLLSELLAKDDALHLVLNLIVIALCPAICEEIFFRGALQQALQRWFRNPHCAILLTAAIFSLAHGDFFAFVPRFILGVLLGYLFHLSGSLIVNCCAHFLNNALIVVLYFLYAKGILIDNPSEPMIFSVSVTVLCFMAGIFFFILYFVNDKSRTRTN